MQRALAEQAAREVSYQRPANKPPPNVSLTSAGPPKRVPPRTVKYQRDNDSLEERPVGPPSREAPQTAGNGPPRREAPRANGAPIAAPPRRAAPVVKQVPIDDEDESDVELLSLSSDDEDEDQGRRAIVLGDKLLKSQGAVADEDEDLWDENDEEPQVWNGVDQAEVSVDWKTDSFLAMDFVPGSRSVKFLMSQTHSSLNELLLINIEGMRLARDFYFSLPAVFSQ